MKNTTNVFLKGMTSDMHPLTTSQQEYTDALNATLITFNGNEQMMQNDMGNTKIQDSKTGNIMGLREGFVPVGLKEHGGIMYIASVNKDGVGEIGTIPSPVIRYNKQKDYRDALDINWTATPSSPSNLYKITDEKLHTGDKFATILQLQDDASVRVDYINYLGVSTYFYYPKYSYQIKKDQYHASNKGLYSVNLFAQTDDQIFDMSDQIQPKADRFSYKIESDIDTGLNKKYWFVNLPNNYDATQMSFDIDHMLALDNASGNKQSPFIKYPNIPAGYPSIQFKTENINSFELSTNKATKHIHPLTKLDNSNNYYAIFPYFIYSTDSAVHVDEIEVCVLDDNGEKQPLYKHSDGTSWGSAESNLTFKISDGEKRYQIESGNVSDFAFAHKNLSSITTKTDPYFNTDDSNALFKMKIGSELNKWYTLNVKYKSNEWDEVLGEYNLRFNQYVMDIEGEFIDVQLEPEETHTQLYDKSEIPEHEFDLQEIYGGNGEYRNSVDYTSASIVEYGLDHWCVNIAFSGNGFVPRTSNDVELDYLYDLPAGHVESYNSFRSTSWEGNNIVQVMIKESNSASTFWGAWDKLITGLRGDDPVWENKNFNISIELGFDAHDETGRVIYSDTGISGTVNIEKHSSDHSIYYSYSGISSDQFSLDYDFWFYLSFKKILDATIDRICYMPAGRGTISYVTLYINHITFMASESLLPSTGIEPRHSYTLYWGKDDVDSDYSLMNNNNLIDEDDGEYGGKGEIGAVGLSQNNITCIYQANTTYTGDARKVLNQGKYLIIPQFNLKGKDKDSITGDYIKYGITTNQLRTKFYPCLIDPDENKLSIIDNIHVFQTIDVKNYISSLNPSIPIKTLVPNASIRITLNPGVYYLGSIIRHFRYTTENGSISLDEELIYSSDIDYSGNYIEITVIPQTFDGSDGDSISMRVSSSNLGEYSGDDYYAIKSGREGGILYLPYGGTINGITAICPENTLLLVQDIGLYKLDLTQFDLEDPLNKKIDNANNIAFYDPNRYYDENDNTSYGYYYVSPQLCWVYYEPGIECIQKEFKNLHFGLHAYQTNFGEYFYDPLFGGNSQVIALPDGQFVNITFRIENDELD